MKRFLLLFIIIISVQVFGQQNNSPNIVVIISDDHAFQTISAYGSTMTQTPGIDRLAKEGALFTNAYVTNSICGPSRATFLSGKYSPLNGFKDNENSRKPAIKPPGLAKCIWATTFHKGWIITISYPIRVIITTPTSLVRVISVHTTKDM